MSRNSWAAIVATVAVVAVVALGFGMLGSPRRQRSLQSDLRTVQGLANLAQQIQLRWKNSEKHLPPNLDTIPAGSKQNPITHDTFVYRVKSSSAYELCTTFVIDTRGMQNPNTSGSNEWAHPKGEYCFQFDASQPVPQPPYIY